jgi:hypothetical protein
MSTQHNFKVGDRVIRKKDAPAAIPEYEGPGTVMPPGVYSDIGEVQVKHDNGFIGHHFHGNLEPYTAPQPMDAQPETKQYEYAPDVWHKDSNELTNWLQENVSRAQGSRCEYERVGNEIYWRWFFLPQPNPSHWEIVLKYAKQYLAQCKRINRGGEPDEELSQFEQAIEAAEAELKSKQTNQ